MRVETTGKQVGMVPFWVLEPMLSNASYCPKIFKTQDTHISHLSSEVITEDRIAVARHRGLVSVPSLKIVLSDMPVLLDNLKPERVGATYRGSEAQPRTRGLNPAESPVNTRRHESCGFGSHDCGTISPRTAACTF